ncbi:type II toxin-antitoxin system RelE/ParE family toxin [Flavobacterium sp. S87F.05.LMB.W.Kidney.N]|uniref:type II toxin-antitoxin system RelE/ParE family toxin n=1 Tax=Flavobacterium sp. S87F.05.LMB.W.Kidney.N TaxID=1278758 RepID=UPI0010669463|nr:type II toxin-antitoxin system RelE/ParE family toxin [Flavobacterium sp. S87F.05.LMB.W.Kidney.N]TDX11359.1 ParE-like toxin of type II ParDE toxin-antitoxin system [Flavobacterium sp. S87F.05.LMB.W.Kidney.N]
MEKEIIWSRTAQNQLEKIYSYLYKETKSKNIPNKVIDSIYNSAVILRTNWEIYELDEMKIPNDKNYRAYEIYNYRITYKLPQKKFRF